MRYFGSFFTHAKIKIEKNDDFFIYQLWEFIILYWWGLIIKNSQIVEIYRALDIFDFFPEDNILLEILYDQNALAILLSPSVEPHTLKFKGETFSVVSKDSDREKIRNSILKWFNKCNKALKKEFEVDPADEEYYKTQKRCIQKIVKWVKSSETVGTICVKS